FLYLAGTCPIASLAGVVRFEMLGVPDESTVDSRASSEGTGSKPGVPDEEKLILEWEADVDSENYYGNQS
ncbi:hypothetical protein Tco_0075966, partial [Tanacetum coccineum]